MTVTESPVEARDIPKVERDEMAQSISSLLRLLDGGESLLCCFRGVIAGGWKGRLNIGPEAIFSPEVHIGLTDKRLVLQHISREKDGLPHSFTHKQIADMQFEQITTFTNTIEGRLIVILHDGTSLRFKLLGYNAARATTLLEVFRTFSAVKQKSNTPQTNCPHCGKVLDGSTKFCPYCGGRIVSAVDEAILHPAPAGVVIMPVEILPPFPEISIPEPVEDIVVPLPEYVMPLGDPFIAEPKAVDIVVPVVFISEVPMESPVAELAAPAIMVEIEPHVHVAVEIATDPVVSVEVLHQSTVKIEGAQLEEIRSAPPPRTSGWSPVQPHPVETSDSNTAPENKGWH